MDPTQPAGRDALTSWIDTYGDRLVQFLWTLTHDAELAQDLAQETFLRLLRQQRAAPGTVIHAGWLYTVARRLAIDHVRQRQRHPEALTDDAGGGTGAGAPEVGLRAAVDDLLDRLSATDREILMLFYYQQWTTDEIAAHYRMPAATVRTRLHRARERFRRLWEGHGHGQ